MSPFSYADKIKTPILLIHGEADDNTGTYPIQSERFYAALKGARGRRFGWCSCRSKPTITALTSPYNTCYGR